MKKRVLGQTGILVSEIGFGGWGIGGFVAGASYGATDDRASIAALRRAFELGINFFDTAPSYGNGRSEELIGEAFAGLTDEIVVATKAGRPHFGMRDDFSSAAIRRSVEDSLVRLRRERIDLLQLHDPTLDQLRSDPEILETLRDLQRVGKIRAFAISTKTPAEAVVALNEFAIPVVQVNFNLVDHRALVDGLFDLAITAKAGLIARTPLAFGFLSGKLGEDTRFPEGDHRANWSRERITQWASAGQAFIGEIAKRYGQSLTQVALRFCLSYPAVSTVIPGMLTIAEVEENASASSAGPLLPQELSSIRQTYAGSPFAAAKIVTPGLAFRQGM